MTRDPYQEVTDRIVAALEAGTVPWRKPWSTAAGAPRSIEGHTYTGINSILLWMSDFAEPRWGTFKMVQKHGGQVRKGERGTFVVFFKPLKVKDEKAPEGVRTVPMLRYYYVFNVEQCDGLELEPLSITYDHDGIEGADAVLANYPNAPAVRSGGSRACYAPSTDVVQMPDQNAFKTAEAYYLTLWHELAHSTGHESRLARKDLAEMARFGDASYSREELCAEIGSSMIAARSNVVAPDIDQSAAYVAGWLRALRSDRKLVISAASRAQKAADWILS